MTREELTKVLKDWKPELELMAKYNDNSIDYQRYSALEKAIEVIEQEPKTGHWIDHQEGRWIYAQCSECGTVHDTRTNYCPNCGAKMESEG